MIMKVMGVFVIYIADIVSCVCFCCPSGQIDIVNKWILFDSIIFKQINAKSFNSLPIKLGDYFVN